MFDIWFSQPGSEGEFWWYSPPGNTILDVDTFLPPNSIRPFVAGAGLLKVPRFGDVDADGLTDLKDIVTLIREVVFATEPSKRGEVTCDGIVDIEDIVAIINWVVFSRGP